MTSAYSCISTHACIKFLVSTLFLGRFNCSPQRERSKTQESPYLIQPDFEGLKSHPRGEEAEPWEQATTT